MESIKLESAITNCTNEVEMAYNDARLIILIKENGLDQKRPYEGLSITELRSKQSEAYQSIAKLEYKLEQGDLNVNSDLRLEYVRTNKLAGEILLRLTARDEAQAFIGKMKDQLQPAADALKRATSLFRKPDHHSATKKVRPQHDTNNPDNKCISRDKTLADSAELFFIDDNIDDNIIDIYRDKNNFGYYDFKHNAGAGKTELMQEYDTLILNRSKKGLTPKNDNITTKPGGTHTETHTQDKHPRKKRASFN